MDTGLDSMAEGYHALHGQSDAEIVQTEPQRTSAPELGDRLVAYSWALKHVPTTIDFASAMVLAHRGDVGYLLLGQVRGISPLPDMANLTIGMIAGGEHQPVTNGPQTGGLWDLLPTLDEVPVDFLVSAEKVHQD